MVKVYFDESGNTGENLLDLCDPVFALASCRFEDKDAEILLSHFDGLGLNELKFAKLRRSNRGKKAVLDFLGSPLVQPLSAAVSVIHKRFMVVTKFCDMFIEPEMFSHGINFYERGLNIATANLLATTMPILLGTATWDSFLSSFVRIMRDRTTAAFREFRMRIDLIRNGLECCHPDVSFLFDLSAFKDPDGKDFYEMLEVDDLDPLVSSFYFLADHWGKRLGRQFGIVADESKVLAKEAPRLLKLCDSALTPVVAGFDRRTIEVPFKVSGIVPVDSKEVRQVQLADLLAGAACAFLKSGQLPGTRSFEEELNVLFFQKDLIAHAIWQTAHVHPKDMGTDQPPSPDQADPIEYFGRVLRNVPGIRWIN